MWPKYKDAAPDETIKRISQALNEVGVHMEATFLEPVANVVSVLLADREHGFETYGKGTSREWALASAYGEAAERFQNRMLYESPAYAPDDRAPFYEWPDEERVTLHKALQSPFIAEDFSRHFTDDSCSAEEFLRNFYDAGMVSNVPYVSCRSGAPVMLPDRIIGTLCGSNGLSSGNTYEEAICQALSELAERYAKFSLFRENIPFAAVPREYLQKAVPDLFQTIEAIEAGSGFRLTVRDARPATGFPVLQVLLTDCVNQRYYTRFGCHPVFRIALERSITELLQGQDDIAALSVMISWPQERPVNSFRNLSDSLKADLADLSDEFLAGITDKQFTPWPSGEFTNTEGVKQLTDAFLRISPDVFIRKTGFLGIPSVRVYIPGVSPLPVQFSRRILEYNKAKKMLHDPDLLPEYPDSATLHLLLDALTADDSLVGSRMDWRAMPIGYEETKGLLLYMLHRDAEALSAFEKAKTAPGKCMYHFLRLTLAEKDDRVKLSVLEMFFGRNVTRFICKVASQRENALSVWLDPTGLYRSFRQMVSVASGPVSPLFDLDKRVKERMMAAYAGSSSH